MKKRQKKLVTIVVVIILILLAVIVATKFLNNSTGKATLTNGASYAQISSEMNRYTNCAYITSEDGWKVTESATLQATDTETGKIVYATDSCVDENNVREYNCESGNRAVRTAVCPSGTSCESGACV
ncbi:MAG: hypothetical protein KKA64_03910 [Nanoarchaeota archaeon]|nr:hypothetical protein [Nanoarchaeota archaeon]